MANGLDVPPILKQRSALKDIDEIFGFSKASPQRSSLAAYFFGLKIKPKTLDIEEYFELAKQALSGSEEAWDKIKEYNIHDAAGTAMIVQLYKGGEL
jgi:hypothetical protein